MKRLYVLGFILVSALFIKCQPETLEAGKFRINGTVEGVDNGEFYMHASQGVDTIKIENGKFTIEEKLGASAGDLSLIKDINFRGMNAENNVSLYVEPKIMQLNLDYSNFSKSVLTGSVTQDKANELDVITEGVRSKYQNEIDGLNETAQRYNKAAKAGASAEELEKIKYEDNEWRIKLAPMYDELNEKTIQFIKDNPKSYVSVKRLSFITRNLTYAEAKEIMDEMDPEHLKTETGKRLVADVEDLQKGVPGAMAGNFNTTDINGEPIKLEDFKGQYLLIDFWASWCVPCRKGNPHLLDLYAKYKSKGLEILGVSDDDRDHDAWRKAVEKDQIGVWRHVLRGLKMKDGRMDFNDRSTDISEGYNISTLPTKILIGPDGVVIGRYGSGGGNDEDMDRDLAKLFE